MNSTELDSVLSKEMDTMRKADPGFLSTLPSILSEDGTVNGTFHWSLTPTYDRLTASGKTWSEFGWGTSGSTAWDLLSIVLFFAMIQGALTFGLHCAELIVILARDEQAWRK